MRLEELKKQAAAVLAIEPRDGYAHHTFSCGSGGVPANKAGVPIAHEECEHEYDTVRWGGAYSGSLTVECRDTGAKDAKGRPIYITPDGIVFVYAYRQGSPENFDGGALVPPVLMTSAD